MNVFNDQVVLYETRDDMERISPGAVDTNAFSNMVTRTRTLTNLLVFASALERHGDGGAISGGSLALGDGLAPGYGATLLALSAEGILPFCIIYCSTVRAAH